MASSTPPRPIAQPLPARGLRCRLAARAVTKTMPRQQASSAFSRPNGSTTASTHPRPGAVGSVAIHRGLFYQSRRIHSALGYISPAEMERRAVLPRQSYRGEEQCTGPGFSPRLNRLDMRGWGCGAATLRRPPPTRRPPPLRPPGRSLGSCSRAADPCRSMPVSHIGWAATLERMLRPIRNCLACR